MAYQHSLFVRGQRSLKQIEFCKFQWSIISKRIQVKSLTDLLLWALLCYSIQYVSVLYMSIIAFFLWKRFFFFSSYLVIVTQGKYICNGHTVGT